MMNKRAGASVWVPLPFSCLTVNVDEIVNQVTERIYELEPTLLERFGDKGKAKCREDNHHSLKEELSTYLHK
jgi:hypothetical protein